MIASLYTAHQTVSRADAEGSSGEQVAGGHLFQDVFRQPHMLALIQHDCSPRLITHICMCAFWLQARKQLQASPGALKEVPCLLYLTNCLFSLISVSNKTLSPMMSP